MGSSPIFIIGTERSGSNLLRLILNSHPDIAVPHPPHFIRYFSPVIGMYGNLSHRGKLKALLKDILKLLDVHIYPWDLKLDQKQILAGATPLGLMGIFFSIYEEYRQQYGKKRWGCKSTFIIDHIPEILRICPKAKFLFLIRDPRDVAASSRKAIFSPFHPYFTARLWRKQQLTGLRFYDSAAGRSCHLIRYEDLITEPENSIRKICDFLEERYEPAMLEFHQTESAQKSARLSGSWQNTDSPVMGNNKNKYLETLSTAEIHLIEKVSGDLMLRLDYSLSSSNLAHETTKKTGNDFAYFKPAWPQLLHYYLLNFYWAARVEFRAFLKDRSYWQFWRRRLFLFRLRLRFLAQKTFLPFTICRD